MKVVSSLANRQFSPRRSWFGLFVESYTSSGSFRGFLDFALFGGLVLLFLHPPDLSALTGGSSPAAPARPGTAAVSGQAPTAAPGPYNAVGKPSVPDKPGTPPAPLEQLRTSLEQFLHLSDPARLPKLREAIDLTVQGRVDEAAEILEKIDDADPNRHYVRAIGHVRRADYAAALSEHRRAAGLGHPSAMYEAAQLLRLGKGTTADLTLAYDYYRQSYDKGIDEAGAHLVFNYYLSANSSLRDYGKALQINEALVAKGNRAAMNNLGLQYAKGWGVPENPVKAVELFRAAAELGYANAMSNLAMCYLDGTGVARDPAAAITWLQKAADQNYVTALFRLGRIYLEGEAGAADPVLASRYLRKAALQNHAPSQLLLGTLYEEGGGIGRDLVQAYLFYGLARARGEAEAGRRLVALEARLTSGERERAHRLLDGALPKKP